MYSRLCFATLLTAFSAYAVAGLPLGLCQRNPSIISAQPETGTIASGTITTFAGNGYGAAGLGNLSGHGGYSGDGGPAAQAELNEPKGVVFDSTGNLYIADTYNNVIRKVAQGTGIITTVAGGGTCSAVADYRYCGDGGPATSAELYQPYSIALDASGNLYIADTLNDAIRRVDSKTNIITTVAGVSYCYATYECIGLGGYGGDGQLATGAKLEEPYALALDSAGDIYRLQGSLKLWRAAEVAAPGKPISWGTVAPRLMQPLRHLLQSVSTRHQTYTLRITAVRLAFIAFAW
jgi:hypothetical protein